MAAATSIILGATALASVGMGTAKAINDSKQAKRAKQDIDNYERQQINFENTMAAIDVPMDQYLQEMKLIQQQSANASEQASSAGARGLSLLPGIQEQLYNAEAQTQAKFQNQLFELRRQQAMMESQNEMAEFQARENREQRELAGYGSLYEAGRQGMWSGINQSIQGVQSIAGMMNGVQLRGSETGAGPVTTPPVSRAGELPTMGDALTRNIQSGSGGQYVYTGEQGFQPVVQGYDNPNVRLINSLPTRKM